MNITLAVDEQLVKRARKIARAQGKSLNQYIREQLERLTARDDADGWIEEFEPAVFAVEGAFPRLDVQTGTPRMTGGSFLDSNVLVYSDDAAHPAKQAAAIALIAELMRTRTGVLSLQVLQEYFAIVTRKLGVDAVTARAKVELLGAFTTTPIDIDDVLGAIDLHRLHQISFWDGLIVRAAQQARCVQIYTEDLQHGRRFEGVEIVNPFLERS